MLDICVGYAQVLIKKFGMCVNGFQCSLVFKVQDSIAFGQRPNLDF